MTRKLSAAIKKRPTRANHLFRGPREDRSPTQDRNSRANGSRRGWALRRRSDLSSPTPADRKGSLFSNADIHTCEISNLQFKSFETEFENAAILVSFFEDKHLSTFPSADVSRSKQIHFRDFLCNFAGEIAFGPGRQTSPRTATNRKTTRQETRLIFQNSRGFGQKPKPSGASSDGLTPGESKTASGRNPSRRGVEPPCPRTPDGAPVSWRREERPLRSGSFSDEFPCFSFRI